MLPQKIATGSEHGEQAALFCWNAIATLYGFVAADDDLCYTQKGYAATTYGTGELGVAGPDAVPELRWLFAIPNGGSRGDTVATAKRVGAQLKAEGVKKGVSDMLLPVPRWDRSGLFIELKREDGGKPSSEQLEFGTFVQSQNFGFMICHGWIEAKEIIKRWMLGPISRSHQKLGS